MWNAVPCDYRATTTIRFLRNSRSSRVRGIRLEPLRLRRSPMKRALDDKAAVSAAMSANQDEALEFLAK